MQFDSTQLIQSNFHGPLVTVLTGFHYMYFYFYFYVHYVIARRQGKH